LAALESCLDLRLTANSIVIPVKPVRVRGKYSKISVRDLITVKIRWRGRNTHIGVGRITVSSNPTDTTAAAADSD
jgi:hypothetical protein